MTKATPADASCVSLADDAVTMQQIPGIGDDEARTLVNISDADIKEDDPRSTEGEALGAFVGHTISDRYVIHQLIGAGGMGAVYRGEQVHLRKRCAIKILLPEAARRQDLVLRFEREAIAGAHVVHPNVVSAVDFGKLPDGSCFLVLEYVEGTPLEDIVNQGPMKLTRALTLARQIASALAAVHDKGIVHRDVKSRNILLDQNEQIKLLDFGLAKVNIELLSPESRNAQPPPALTGEGVVMGTLAYIAPEAVRGMEAVDARSDLYALGVVMYEMLAGTRPYDEKDPVLLFRRLRTGRAPSIHEKAPDVTVPADVEAIVAKLLEHNPADRYASANDLIAAIDAVVEAAKEDTPQEEEKPATKSVIPMPSLDPIPAPKPFKFVMPERRILLMGGGGLALVLLIVLVVALRGSSSDKDAKKTALVPMASASSSPEAPAEMLVEIDGIDAAGWRERMRKAIPKKEWLQGARALLALTKLDPELVTSGEMRGDVIAVAAGIGFETTLVESNQVFDALTNDVGSGGLDILFQIMRTRGGSKAASKASDILARPEVLSRATPALRIALDLRKAPCHDKRSFFARAAEEGDERALDELVIAQQGRCPRPKDPCCYREDPEMKETISKLRARLAH